MADVASRLGFGSQDIKDIVRVNGANAEGRSAFLREWIHRDGSAATYEKLFEVLENLDKNGAAERIRNNAEKVVIIK